jgi:hypothetical protein
MEYDRAGHLIDLNFQPRYSLKVSTSVRASAVSRLTMAISVRCVGVDLTIFQLNIFLGDLIIAGKAKPSFVVSHNLPLEDAPEAFEKFSKREEGYTKILLHP